MKAPKAALKRYIRNQKQHHRRITAMLDAIEPGNFQGANAKLMKQVTEISLYLVGFCDGCLMHMTDTYFGRDRQSLNPEEIELPDPPSRNEIEVPFFSE